jgi:catechol 2,3-dioxygenase-like lactoylglutathione lyase family enzyme
MNIEVIGIDHIYLAVADLERSTKFYDKLMPILGFRKSSFTNDGDPHFQYYNRHFGIVLRPAHNKAHAHDPLSPGLNHLCFRVDNADVVDAIANEFTAAGIKCSAPKRYPEYAPDYYAIFFTDPDGIRFEVTNFRDERRKRLRDWDRTA